MFCSCPNEDGINQADTSDPIHEEGKNPKNEKIVLSDAPENHLLPVNKKNPFLLHLVIDVLFSHIDKDTFRSTRQVCPLWNDIALPVFRQRSTAVIPQLQDVCNHECRRRNFNGEICIQFLQTMENRSEEDPPFTALRIENIDMEGADQVFTLYGSYLTSIVISFRPNDDDTVSKLFFSPMDLKRILLYWCKNLVTLELKNLPFGISKMEDDFFQDENSSILASKVTYLKWSDDRPATGLTSPTVANNFVIHLVRIMPLLTKAEGYFDNDYSLEGFMHGLVQADGKGYLSNLNSCKYKDTDSSLKFYCGEDLRQFFAFIREGYE